MDSGQYRPGGKRRCRHDLQQTGHEPVPIEVPAHIPEYEVRACLRIP